MNVQGQSTDLIDMVRAEKLQLLFRHSYQAIFVSFLVACMMVSVLWSVQDHSVLLIWIGLLSISSVVRYILFIRFREKERSTAEILNWEKPYFVTLMLSSIVWGTGGVYLMPLNSPYHQLIILYFLMGLVGGAIASYSTHRVMTLLTVAVVIFPVTIWISLRGTSSIPLISVAGCAAVLFCSLYRSTKILSTTISHNLIANYELKREKEKVEYLALRDPLTNLYNSRAFYEQLGELGAYAERHEEPLSIIIVDADNFKYVNDKYGHFAGDVALTTIGKILALHTRPSDICARIGGEEFAILIRSSKQEGVVALAEKLREKIASTKVEFEDVSFSITASFGVATGHSNFPATVRDADMAMYRAKADGRNRVVCA